MGIESRYGKKRRYGYKEITDFLNWLSKRYTKPGIEGRKTSTYVVKFKQLKAFLDSLPEDEHGRGQPIPRHLRKAPSYPDKFYQPAFTPEEIDKICYAAVMDEKPEVVLRLAIATIYGCRRSELVKLSPGNFNLDNEQSTIQVPTSKKGRVRPQPIPTELLPLFKAPLTPKKGYQIQRDLKRICCKAGVPCPHGAGWHSVRRAVVTALWGNTDLKEIAIRRFLRWSEGMGLGVMPRYIKTPVEVTDYEVLSQHPFVRIWQDLVLFIPYMPQWQKYLDNWLNIQYFST